MTYPNSPFFGGTVMRLPDEKNTHTIKVMVHGHHNVGNNPIPIDDLPDAHCVMNNSPSLNGVGHSINYLPDTTVFGVWHDGPDGKQIPIILGSMHRGDKPDYSS